MPRLSWAFVSYHALIAAYLTLRPHSTVRSISDQLGISERRVAGIIRELREAGYLTVTKDGARNRYAVTLDAPMRWPLFAAYPISRVIEPLATLLRDSLPS